MNAIRALIAALLFLSPETAPSEKFIPPNVGDAKLIVCGVGGQAGGFTDAIAQVEYDKELHAEWRVLLSRRDNFSGAVEDCRNWFADVRVKFMEARRGDATAVPKPQVELSKP